MTIRAKTCGTCRHLHPDIETYDRNLPVGEWGECRVNPPVSFADEVGTHGPGTWPPVRFESWCSRWEINGGDD